MRIGDWVCTGLEMCGVTVRIVFTVETVQGKFIVFLKNSSEYGIRGGKNYFSKIVKKLV